MPALKNEPHITCETSMSQIENSGRLEEWKDGRVRVITKSWSESVTLFRLRDPKIETATQHNSAYPPSLSTFEILSTHYSIAPSLHYSDRILPSFHRSVTALLHYSARILPFFQPSNTPSLHYSITPLPLSPHSFSATTKTMSPRFR
jgi:hypothetical protein